MKTKNITPVLIHVPHASTRIPEEEKAFFAQSEISGELLRLTDHFCDDLYRCRHEMLVFPYSRLVCDVERFPDNEDEIMYERGMGFAYTHGSMRQRIRHMDAEHEEYIKEKYYMPHHRRFEEMVEERLAAYDRCLIVDGHSFPGSPLPYELADRGRRPEICIGTDDCHTGKALTERVRKFFEDKGYETALDYPYAGAVVPLKYYRRDRRVKSVMIEVNRDLYMDRQGNRKAGYDRVRKDLSELLNSLGEGEAR